MKAQRQKPEVVAIANELRNASLSFKKIAVELQKLGHVNKNGKRFSNSSVRDMIPRALRTVPKERDDRRAEEAAIS